MDIFKLTSIVSNVFDRSDDDFSDRLNYRYTVALLILSALILSTRQYGSEVIRCWVPAHFKPSYEQYVSQICWVQNTYYLPSDKAIPQSEEEREDHEIKYYQWVTFVLLFQAFMFYLPRIFWTTFSLRSGLNIGDLTQAADKYRTSEDFEKRRSYMNYMVKNIDQLVDDKRRSDHSSKHAFISVLRKVFPCYGRFLGNYLVVLYILTKVIYIVNAIIQVHLVGTFLGESFWGFGYNLVRETVLHGGWVVGWTAPNSKYFPRVTLCDFKIREIGNPNKSHRYTVQCVLPVNLFNQQIFTVIWFWYIIILVWNMYNFMTWIKRIYPYRAKEFIKKRTNLFNENVKLKLVQNRFHHFVCSYLEPDGIFIIRMIGENTGDYVATDLIHKLWCQHNEKYGALFPQEPHISVNSPLMCPYSGKNVFFESDKIYDNN